MSALSTSLAADFVHGEITLVRASTVRPDIVLTLSADEMEALLAFWWQVRPKPTEHELETILAQADALDMGVNMAPAVPAPKTDE